MNKNLVADCTKQFEDDMKILEQMNNFRSTLLDKEKISLRGSLYENLKTRAQALMGMVMEEETPDPLNVETIKKFNVALQKKIFSNELDHSKKINNFDKSLFDKVRELIFQPYKLNNIAQTLLNEETQSNGNFNKATDYYRKLLEQQLGRSILDTLDDKNNNSKKNFFNSSQNQEKNYLIQKKTKQTMSFDVGDFSFNLIFSPSYINTIVDRIYTLDYNFLNGHKNKVVKDMAIKFLEKNVGVIKEEMRKTLISYNTSILGKLGKSFSAFKGFYGEAMTGALLRTMDNKIKTEQVGANKEFQKSTKRKQLEYLKQTPTDVLVKINGKTYRFQVKQWTNESLEVHTNEKNELTGGLGRTSIEYIGNEDKDLRYFYRNSKEVKVIQRLISAPFFLSSPEKSDYLENRPDLFQHLVFGAFRIETFLPYLNKYVRGNDFFSIRGYLIPSVYFIEKFLEQIKDEEKQSGLITIDTVETNTNLVKIRNHRPLDSFKVNIRGLSVDIKNFGIY